MTTLQSIGLTLAGGSCVLVVSLCSFGLAIQHRSTFIAARAAARPSDVIWNPRPILKSHQQRGRNPWTGWIPWTLQLTYDTMLNGIPGTGTRAGGMSGSLLKVNLDGIVLIRFHALGLRVSCVAAALLIVLALPSYLSAQCYTRLDEQEEGAGCGSNEYNLTNYERTTLANVPSIDHSNYEETIFTPNHGILWRLYLVVGAFWVIAGYLCSQLKEEWVQILAMRRVYYLEYDIWGARREELKQTLMYEEIAAQKREQREHELLQQNGGATSPQQASILAAAAGEDSHLTHRDPWIPHPEQRDTVPNIALYSILVGGLPSLPDQAADSFNADAAIQFSKRESIDWQLSLTTTFFDHCVPNQPGFSSSVAAVTIIPSAMDLSVAWRKWYAAAAKLRRLRFIRQQIALRRHYDIEVASCSSADEEDKNDVYGYDDGAMNNHHHHHPKEESPKQGGGSETDYGYGQDSSDYGYGSHKSETDYNQDMGYGDPSLSSSRKDDYDYNKKGRRFGNDSSSSSQTDYGYGDPSNKSTTKRSGAEIDYGYGDDADEVFVRADATDEELAQILEQPPPRQKFVPKMPKPDRESWNNEKDVTPRGVYSDPQKNKEYYKAVLGSALGNDHETHIYDSLEFGPEQAAVYAREFAQSAAPICPNGCCEGRVRRAPIDHLLEMERIVAVEVHQANLELREARKRATRADVTFTNLHDAQRGVNMEVNHAAPASVAGGAMYASPHSMAGGGSTFRRASAVPNLTTMQEADNEQEIADDGDAISVHGVTALVQQPMASRYDRRRSNHNEGEEAAALVERPKTKPIDMNRLDMVAASNDLGLEAQLFKKSSDHTGGFKQGPRNLAGPSRTRVTSAMSEKQNKLTSMAERSKSDMVLTTNTLRRPSSLATRSQSDGGSPVEQHGQRRFSRLLGVKVPEDLSLEAELIGDYSTGSTGSRRSWRPSMGNRRVNTNQSNTAAGASSSTSSDELRRRRDANRAMSKQEELDTDKESHNDTFKSGTGGSISGHWLHVESIITEAASSDRSTSTSKSVSTGKWEMPSVKNLFQLTRMNTNNIKKVIQKQTKEAVDHLARESTYAVVTFTSRQAAVAARACLADGRGAGRWVTFKEMPIPPLADAAPGDLMTFRNWCRPVTLSINERQKNCRHYIALVLLGTIFVFYTIPLTAASKLATPDDLLSLFPEIDGVSDERLYELTVLLSGLLTAAIWSAFFAFCPALFQTVANFGSKAVSAANAEFKALQYFWWFMVLTAFSGQLLANMALSALNEGFGSQFQDLLRTIAQTIPSQISVNWINWIIFRFTIVLPMNYLAQVNTFVFHCLGLYSCSRMVRGGGPGGPVPYRIYIDSGVVIMCLMALAPASPLVAPACVAYFLFCQPMLRWNLIFLYRPKFDGGGFRWPFIFDMCITTLMIGSVLLAVQMALKQAAGPAIAAIVVMVPAFLFQNDMKARFLRAFEDAALLQTSLLDGWDNAHDYSFEKREEFRQFLVDAHKAAYIPICLAGTDTDEFLTAEPAVIVEDEELDELWDEEEEESQVESPLSPQSEPTAAVPLSPRKRFTSVPTLSKRSTRSLAVNPPASPSPPPAPTESPDELGIKSPVKKSQHGVTLRRTANKMRRRASNMGGCLVDQNHIAKRLEDQNVCVSPFERPLVFEQESAIPNILEAAPTRQRRRSLASGSSWRSKSASSLDPGIPQRPASRGSVVVNRPRTSSRDQSWVSRTSSNLSSDFSSLQEEIEISSADEPSTSYTDTSTSKNGAKFD